MFDLDRHYNRQYNQPIVLQNHINQVHSGVSYQWAIYQKDDRHGCESPSGYGA